MPLFGAKFLQSGALAPEKVQELEDFQRDLIAHALAQSRHPAVLRELADELEHTIREHFAPGSDLGAADSTEGNNLYLIAVGDFALADVVNGYRTIAYGMRSGHTLRAPKRCILIGNFTGAPTPDAVGFVNIDNQLMYWRDSGELA